MIFHRADNNMVYLQYVKLNGISLKIGQIYGESPVCILS